MIPTASLDPQRLAAALTAELPDRDLFERLALTAARIPGRVVLTTSFGIEDQALTHAVFTQDLPVEVVTFDTGRLFPETHQVWADTEARYGRRVRGLSPDRRRLETLV